MGRQIIELVQVLIDRIEKNGYQQRAREDDIADVYKRLNEAEGQAKHWKQARQDAIEAGELMRAEIETLRQELADAKRDASDEFTERQVLTVEQQQDAAAWQQQVDSANAEVSYLRQQLDAALALLTRERLDAETTEPTPVAEPLDAESDTCPGK